MHAFDWDTARIEPDDHPEERRSIACGEISSRLHVVVFTERGNRIRIISLRKANPREE
ncbi:MAG: BrnT family toxin [Acidobacteria bacterium]|nr:BrnT family toxin [Acidobacteriota bacterium]